MLQESISQYPTWAQVLATRYFSRTVCEFILHGNIYDLVIFNENEDSKLKQVLPFYRFLSDELFAQRSLCIFYDRSKGIHFRDSHTKQEFQTFFKSQLSSLPRTPVGCFKLIQPIFSPLHSFE